MPVTKETYTANAIWTPAQCADLFRDAFIDAGLMTDWHDSFSASSTSIVRVLKIEHNSTKTFGSSFYAFNFTGSSGGDIGCQVHLASGWNPAGAPPVNVPTGTQYLDYERLPASYSGGVYIGSRIQVLSSVSNLFLDRYTSQDDTRQSWFVLRQGNTTSDPFTILHKDTILHSWLNLDQGIISGFQTVKSYVDFRAGMISFKLQENLRRCLLTGTALRGVTSIFNATFHDASINAYTYVGLGSESATYTRNMPSTMTYNYFAATILPVGKSVANPAFITDYIPICNDLPWSPWTPTLLASDFGICMFYDNNSIGYGDRIIVQSALNEWQVIERFNNDNVNDGATATFLARII